MKFKQAGGSPLPIPDWMQNQEFVLCHELDPDSDSPQYDSERKLVDSYDEANLISSKVVGTDGLVHRPVLDIDLPCFLVPSTTEGHFHLVIDKPLPKEKYFKLLEALVEAEILQAGYVRAGTFRGATFIRKPGVRKT